MYGKSLLPGLAKGVWQKLHTIQNSLAITNTHKYRLISSMLYHYTLSAQRTKTPEQDCEININHPLTLVYGTGFLISATLTECDWCVSETSKMPAAQSRSLDESFRPIHAKKDFVLSDKDQILSESTSVQMTLFFKQRICLFVGLLLCYTNRDAGGQVISVLPTAYNKLWLLVIG